MARGLFNLAVSAATLAIAALSALPALAQSQPRFFGDTIDAIDDLLYQLNERTERQQIVQALNLDNLVFAVTVNDGTDYFIDSTSVDREGYWVYFADVHVVNSDSFIRTYRYGNCSSGEMGQSSAEAWHLRYGLLTSGISIPLEYYPPNTYARQILSTACTFRQTS